MKPTFIALLALCLPLLGAVSLAGCGGGNDAGGKNESNKSAADKTSQKGSGNEKPDPKLPKDTFGGERNSIAGSTPTKESGNEKPLPKPPKDSLAAFLWGKKIVFKQVRSKDQTPRMFIFGKNGKISMAVGSPDGFVKTGHQLGAYEVVELKVKFAEILDFPSKTPKAGDTVTIGREDRVYATLSIEKIFGADEDANIKELPKSVFKRANMMKSTNTASGMAVEMLGAETETEEPYPAAWGDLILKGGGGQDGLSIFISPRSSNYEKLRAQLKAQLEAGKEIKKEDRISHYAINKSMIGKFSFDGDPPDSTVLFFECELGWNGAGGLEDALKFMDKHKLNAIAIAHPRGGGRSVTREELKQLTWKVGP